MSETRRYLDFEVVKEPWNKYSLRDGSKLKTRVMLKSAWYLEKDGKKNYTVDIQNTIVMMCDPSLQGSPGQAEFSNEQIRKNIEVEDSRYDTIAYEANEYILDDNTRILIHSNITRIARTKLFDPNGDRIYVVESNASMMITPPKQ